MKFNENEIATYMFCAQLSQTKTLPLTIIEWNIVVKSLSEHSFEPKVLFSITYNDLSVILTKATENQKKRILHKVIKRQKLGVSVLEIQEIINQGYGIMFRSKMPSRLKKLPQKYLPAFFYYAGDPSILSNFILGVVGARNANSEELQKTAKIAKDATSNGIAILSGGARGVDSIAVESALESGGKAIIFPSEGLAKWIKKSKIRQYILNGQLLLMSTQKLESSFSGSYAMQRNKFIHAPSDSVLVSSSKISGTKKSGTWEGVIENVKHKWSPIYVIGSSEGVEKLKYKGHADVFPSIEEIYKNINVLKNVKSNNINNLMIALIKQAIFEEMDEEMLNKKFKELSIYYYNKSKNLQKETYINEENVEQLSFEEFF